MQEVVRDLRLAVRAWRNAPGATLAIVLALALGIGVNASCFISVNALVLHPFPFPQLDRLMTVWESAPKIRTERAFVAPANFLDWQAHNSAFEKLAAYRTWNVNLTGAENPEHVDAYEVSPDFFTVLGTAPAIGRTFRADEAQPGQAGVVVVSHGFWQRHLAGASDVIGRNIKLDGQQYTIAGVMPSDVDFPLEAEVWRPLALTPEQRQDRMTHTLMVLGRLRPGVSVAQARAEMDTLSGRLASEYPDANEGRAATVVPIRELTNEITDRFALILLATAIFVLLLACANVANLQLARVAAREREFAVRTALGASRMRLIRQMLVESVALALPAGMLGLMLAAWNLSLTAASIPAQVLHWVAGLKFMRIDATVVAFTLLVSLLAAILCSVPALLHFLRGVAIGDTSEALKQGGRGGSSGPAHSRWRNGLAVTEVALALILLVGAGIMVQTFQRMLSVNRGFNPQHLLTVRMSLPIARYENPSQMTQFDDRLVQHAREISEVQDGAAVAPLASPAGVWIEGRPDPRPGDTRPLLQAISDEYFQTLQLPLITGRAITTQDGPETAPAVVLSESVARRYWPQGNAVGQRLRFTKAAARWFTVVGVVRDVKEWFSGTPLPTAYVALDQNPPPYVSLLLRTQGDPLRIEDGIRSTIHNLDSSVPVLSLKTMEQELAEQTSGVRIAAFTMAGYAAIALVLAITGIYSLIAYTVVQRTREIGIRLALGAKPSDVLTMVLQQGFRLAGLGLGIGVPVAYVLTRVLSNALYGVVAIDAERLALLSALLAASAIAAAWIPARRAARSDAVVALHHD